MHFSDDATDRAALDVVDDGLGAFNGREPALADVRPLATFVRDDGGTVLGGAVGRYWGITAELQQLWVHDSHRGRGLGRTLLQRFESAAAAQGVTLVYLDTFSFQAPRFYARAGYTTVVLIEGFTHGIGKHHMHKRLDVARA